MSCSRSTLCRCSWRASKAAVLKRSRSSIWLCSTPVLCLQDLRDLALVVAQRAGHAVFQQRHALAQRGQRRLELVRDVAQKARFVGVQFDQAQPQPVQPLPDQRQVGRPLDGDHLVEPVLAQAHDGVFQAPQRQGEPHAEGQRHGDGQHDGPGHLLCQALAAGLQLAFERLVALLDGLLHLHRDGGVDAFQLAELLRQLALAVQRGVGRAGQQAGNRSAGGRATGGP